MGSATGRYRKNSPEAVASVLAALVVSDGHLDPREMALIDDLGLLTIVGVPRETFLRVVGETYAGIRRQLGERPEARVSRSTRLDAALDAVEDRNRRLLVAAVLLYLADADRIIDDDEIALVRQVFRRWAVTAQALEQELDVPPERTRPFFDSARLGAE